MALDRGQSSFFFSGLSLILEATSLRIKTGVASLCALLHLLLVRCPLSVLSLNCFTLFRLKKLNNGCRCSQLWEVSIMLLGAGSTASFSAYYAYPGFDKASLVQRDIPAAGWALLLAVFSGIIPGVAQRPYRIMSIKPGSTA